MGGKAVNRGSAAARIAAPSPPLLLPLLLLLSLAPRRAATECRALGSFDLRFRGNAAECTVDRARADAAAACIDKQSSLYSVYNVVRPCATCGETGGRSFIVQNFYGPSTWTNSNGKQMCSFTATYICCFDVQRPVGGSGSAGSGRGTSSSSQPLQSQPRSSQSSQPVQSQSKSLPPPPQQQQAAAPTSAKYKATVKTSRAMFAGTDSPIVMEIYGDNGKSTGPVTLDASGGGFENGATDVVEFEAPYVGRVSRVAFSMPQAVGMGPGWLPESVRIEQPESGQDVTISLAGADLNPQGRVERVAP